MSWQLQAIIPGPSFFPIGSTITPANGAIQAITIPFAGAVTLKSLLSGAALPYLTNAGGGKVYPTYFTLILRIDAGNVARLRYDGDPTADLGELIPQEPSSPLIGGVAGCPLPIAQFKVIASGADQPAIISFWWEAGRT